MQAAIDLFRENIRRSKELTSVYEVMNRQTTGALDLSDVLRASLVTSVSSLDHFIHEVVRFGMLEVYRIQQAKTPAFLRFRVTLESVLLASADPNSQEWLENQIRVQHGHLSFQMPDNIADAVRLISEVSLWSEVAQILGIGSRDVTDRLTLIVQRRNKIAHEADITPDHAGQMLNSDSRSPIDKALVDDAIDFIEHIAEAIFQLIVSPAPAATSG